MRPFKRKPYKIKPYRSYRKKKRKMKTFLISMVILLISIVVFGFILPAKKIVPWKPIKEMIMIKKEPKTSPVDKELGGTNAALERYHQPPGPNYSLHTDPVKVKGIYVSGNRAGSKEIDDLIDLCNRTELNAMIIDVKSDDGYLTFNMESPGINELGIIPNSVPIKDIDILMEKLYRNNIYPIARIVALKDSTIKEKHPEYMLKNKDGSFYESNEPGGQKATWLNPYNKEVWDYIVTVSKGAAAVGFKEIQFDYIRFHEGASSDKVDLGPEAAKQEKSEIISQLVKYVVEQLHKEDVYVSADVFGAIITSEIDAQIVGQDYTQLARYLDYICPMVYPSHYANGSFGVEHPDLDPYQILLGSMAASRARLKDIKEGEHKAIVRPWLQDFTASWVPMYQQYGPQQIKDQIQGVYDAGLEEWILWNAANRYTEGGLLAK